VTPTAVPSGSALLPALWIDGEPCQVDGPHISAADRGLLLADGVFETMRVQNGVVFRLDRHLARLEHGLAVLGIPLRRELRGWLLDAVASAGRVDAGLRLTVTRGVGAGGVAPQGDVRPTVIVAIGPLPVFAPEIFDRGLAAHVASGRRNERAMTAGLKTLAFTDAVAAMMEARRSGADESLFLDSDGHCSEATASNLFIWTGVELLTPPLSCGPLPGITRAAVLEVASALHIPAEERPFDLERLLRADEAFLTSSLRGLTPLVRVNGRPIGHGVPGAVSRRLTAAYAGLLARECGDPRP
jgi:branched-chain amino acid aminotransferase